MQARDWHPKARQLPIAFYLDPTFSGFSVVVDSSAPEVAAALERRLGAMVRVSLGKPGRLSISNQPGSGRCPEKAPETFRGMEAVPSEPGEQADGKALGKADRALDP